MILQREKRMDETVAKALLIAKPGSWSYMQSQDLWYEVCIYVYVNVLLPIYTMNLIDNAFD